MICLRIYNDGSLKVGIFRGFDSLLFCLEDVRSRRCFERKYLGVYYLCDK